MAAARKTAKKAPAKKTAETKAVKKGTAKAKPKAPAPATAKKKPAPKKKPEEPAPKAKLEEPAPKPKLEEPAPKPKLAEPAPKRPKEAAPKKPAVKRAPAKSAPPAVEPSVTPSPRAAANDDEPRAPTAYRVDFSGKRRWPSVEVGAQVFTGDVRRAPLVEAGKPFVVVYQRSPADLDHRGELASVELYYRFNKGPIHMQLVAPGVPNRIEVPRTASGELQYWFRMTTTDGRALWDSDFARNYRAEIIPAGEVWVMFEGERSA